MILAVAFVLSSLEYVDFNSFDRQYQLRNSLNWLLHGTRLRCGQTVSVCHVSRSGSIQFVINSRPTVGSTSVSFPLLYQSKANTFTMEIINDDQILASFRTLDKKFRRSCHHIRMLNRQIEDIQIRYDRAFSSGRRSFRYTHRLKLATCEGMRNMYYEYACRRADELEKMQDCLIQRGMISESDEESDADMQY